MAATGPNPPDRPEPGRTPMGAAEIDAAHVTGAAPRLDGPIELVAYDPGWPAAYAREERRIRAALGGEVVTLDHVGSTSVPGLPAKPILDLLLTVPDPAAEERYVPRLAAAGYPLEIREPEWYEHRVLRRRAVLPAVNLHVFGAGCPEVDRMLRFRDRLRDHDEERDRYAAVKRELAGRRWAYVQHYADAKTEVVREILARAEAAADRRRPGA